MGAWQAGGRARQKPPKAASLGLPPRISENFIIIKISNLLGAAIGRGVVVLQWCRVGG